MAEGAEKSQNSSNTRDVEATCRQVEALRAAGAGLVRVAVDNQKDADGLVAIRERTAANLVVDLQENYRIVSRVAPHVDKVRYNPGHLYHVEKDKPVREKVRFIAEMAGEHDCALRVGVNCGSVDPEYKARFPGNDVDAMVSCALDHAALLDELG